MERKIVSHYRILERLGGGGMGVVYKARDERLDRYVAVKFLPPELTRDEDARLRFVQEAKAASALEHANICTIHEIDETPEGQAFLVMAYYDGETLKKRIERSPLKLDEALDVAIQIGQGLAAAHESGIAHRDVKPANVMVTRRGEVKVVDFGLAKLLGQTGLTRTGTTLGTVAYMSPEQAGGDEVDHRSDIWSLGVVLFEMLTGQLPFRGENAFAVSNAILHSPPIALSSLRSGMPLEIERVINRALSKRADERYQTMAHFVAELRFLRSATEPDRVTRVAAPATVVVRPSRQLPIAAAIVVGSLALAGVVAYWPLRPARQGEAVPRLSGAVQVTSAVGVEEFPSWSPEGGRLTYQSGVLGDNTDIWVTQIGGGSPVNRTADNLEPDAFPSWSPDGRYIAFRSDRGGPAIYVMPAVGGSPRLIKAVRGPPGGPRWSPDGTQLAYIVQDEAGLAVEITSVESGISTRLNLPGRSRQSRFELSWSSDGRFFAFVDSTDLMVADVTQILLLRVVDRSMVPVTDGRTKDVSPTWSSDGRTLYFVSNRGGSIDLWQQAIGDDGGLVGPAQPLTAGIGMRRAVFSPDGQKLAYSKGSRVSNIWRVPIFAERPATWADAQQITFDEAYIEHADLSPDGRRLGLTTNRTGNPDLWTLPAEGGEMQQLTNDPTPDWYPRWSPDGKELVFYAYRSGHRNVWVMPAVGGPARQVTRTDATDWYPAWSPDGRLIAFRSNRTGNSEIWIVPTAGGEPWQASAFGSIPGGRVIEWMSDGKRLVGTGGQPLTWWFVSASGGKPEPAFKGQVAGEFYRFSPDRQTLYFQRASQYWALSLKGGYERPVTDLKGRPGFADRALATDGHYLYFGWADDRGDLWVMDVRK